MNDLDRLARWRGEDGNILTQARFELDRPVREAVNHLRVFLDRLGIPAALEVVRAADGYVHAYYGSFSFWFRVGSGVVEVQRHCAVCTTYLALGSDGTSSVRILVHEEHPGKVLGEALTKMNWKEAHDDCTDG